MIPLQHYHRWIEGEIAKQKFGKQPASLYEPIRYLMRLGGKRLRPMLTLLSYSLFRDDVRTIVPYAVAVEAFHNFTLMHDDIMDRAPLRRGMATVHEKWNVNTAILSGDVMLVKVYEMFGRLDAGLYKSVTSAFNQCAISVCEGQQWDMQFETTGEVSESQYLNMIRLKTAALLGFSMELGAILADASEREREHLRESGINMGIGFQLRDDLLDAYADPGKFGKQVGGDIISNKRTYLLIHALRKADDRTKAELIKWLTLKKFRKQEKVKAVKSIFDRTGAPGAASRKISLFFEKGFSSLEKVGGDQDARNMLRAYAKALVDRQV